MATLIIMNSLGVKIGKACIWILGSSLILIEVYERLNESFSLGGYTFILLLLCVLLILLIIEIYNRNKQYLNTGRFFK